MKVLITPITYHIRGFNDDVNIDTAYKNSVPYEFIGTLQVHNKEGFFSGFHGKINLSIMREVRNIAKTLNLDSIYWFREGERVEVYSRKK